MLAEYFYCIMFIVAKLLEYNSIRVCEIWNEFAAARSTQGMWFHQVQHVPGSESLRYKFTVYVKFRLTRLLH